MDKLPAYARGGGFDPIELMVLDGKKPIPLTKDQAIRLASSLLSIALKTPEPASLPGASAGEGAQGVIFGAKPPSSKGAA